MPAWWLYGERVNGRTAVGMLLGFLGLLMVALPGGGGMGAWLSVLAAVAITGGTLLSRQLTGVDIVQATGWHFLVGGVVLAVVASGVDGLPAHGGTPQLARESCRARVCEYVSTAVGEVSVKKKLKT